MGSQEVKRKIFTFNRKFSRKQPQMASNDLKWPQNARILKNYHHLFNFFMKPRKTIFGQIPKYSASNEKLHLKTFFEFFQVQKWIWGQF